MPEQREKKDKPFDIERMKRILGGLVEAYQTRTGRTKELMDKFLPEVLTGSMDKLEKVMKDNPAFQTAMMVGIPLSNTAFARRFKPIMSDEEIGFLSKFAKNEDEALQLLMQDRARAYKMGLTEMMDKRMTPSNPFYHQGLKELGQKEASLNFILKQLEVEGQTEKVKYLKGLLGW